MNELIRAIVSHQAIVRPPSRRYAIFVVCVGKRGQCMARMLILMVMIHVA